ncbi:MAG: Ig-like domain-containing protein [Methanomicrobiales archaeon]|nr:Ig-like domain-containing protein [Methanomicrobiales archaeon]
MRGRATLWLMLLFLLMPIAVSAQCPAPKVVVMPTGIHGEGLTDEEAAALNDAFSISLRSSNPEIQLLSQNDLSEMLRFEEQRALLGYYHEGAWEERMNEIGAASQAEYIVTLEISRVGSEYVLTSALLDVDLAASVHRVSGRAYSKDGLPGAVRGAASAFGDLKGRIDAWERTHNSPPRAPVIQLSMAPAGVTFEEGHEEASIVARVTDCHGNPVAGLRVYLPEQTSRGYLRETDGREGEFLYSLTDRNGQAQAIYHAWAAKGVHAGSDTIQAQVHGRGGRIFRVQGEVMLYGIAMDARAEKASLGRGESTGVAISLYEVTPQGGRRPLQGRMILVEKHLLLDGFVTPAESLITDPNGQAFFTFTAGQRVGYAKIPVVFQPQGYTDAVRQSVVIEVKRDEFVIQIDWTEGEHRTYEPLNPYFVRYDIEQSFRLASNTKWDRLSRKERTDATLQYQYTYRSWNDGMETKLGSCRVTIPPITNPGSLTASVSGRLKGREEVNRLVREDTSGNLLIAINALPLEIPLTGQWEMASDMGPVDVLCTNPCCTPQGCPYPCPVPFYTPLSWKNSKRYDFATGAFREELSIDYGPDYWGHTVSQYNVTEKSYVPRKLSPSLRYPLEQVLAASPPARDWLYLEEVPIDPERPALQQFRSTYALMKKTGSNSFEPVHLTYSISYCREFWASETLCENYWRDLQIRVVRA